MILRPAIPEDAPALAKLRWDFRSPRVDPPREDEATFVSRCTAWMRSALADPDWRCFVADDTGTIVGNAWVRIIHKIPNPGAERERHAYFTNLYVSPAHRSVGLGARLIEMAVVCCRDLDVDTVVLWPTEKSRRLYARHGFGATTGVLARSNLDEPE